MKIYASFLDYRKRYASTVKKFNRKDLERGPFWEKIWFLDFIIYRVVIKNPSDKSLKDEAGIEAWIEPLKTNKTWKVYAPKVHENEFAGVDTEFYED